MPTGSEQTRSARGTCMVPDNVIGMHCLSGAVQTNQFGDGETHWGLVDQFWWSSRCLGVV